MSAPHLVVFFHFNKLFMIVFPFPGSLSIIHCTKMFSFLVGESVGHYYRL
uniref:Uncharacterized protein n=1 Tax=Arundo donax TaxID=35708 RepID=A0A0A9ESW5_ARUDO